MQGVAVLRVLKIGSRKVHITGAGTEREPATSTPHPGLGIDERGRAGEDEEFTFCSAESGVRPVEHLVADLGVGDGAVFLPQVEPQLAFVAEIHVALFTMIRLLSGVDADVALEGLQVSEAGPAGPARVRLFPCMDQDVGPQVGNLHEARSARLALVGLLPRVDAQMGLEVGRPVKLRSANSAAIRFLPSVTGVSPAHGNVLWRMGAEHGGLLVADGATGFSWRQPVEGALFFRAAGVLITASLVVGFRGVLPPLSLHGVEDDKSVFLPVAGLGGGDGDAAA